MDHGRAEALLIAAWAALFLHSHQQSTSTVLALAEAKVAADQQRKKDLAVAVKKQASQLRKLGGATSSDAPHLDAGAGPSSPPDPTQPSAPAKRSRGRPRKEVSAADTASVSWKDGDHSKQLEPVPDKPSAAKRGRGRPRKNAPSRNLGLDEPVKPAKRGRGRPRKHFPGSGAQSAQNLTPAEAAAQPVKRGRGRPRKKVRVDDDAPAEDVAPEEAAAMSSEERVEPGEAPAAVSVEPDKPQACEAIAAASVEIEEPQVGEALAAASVERDEAEASEALAAASVEPVKRGRGRPRKKLRVPKAPAAQDLVAPAVSASVGLEQPDKSQILEAPVTASVDQPSLLDGAQPKPEVDAEVEEENLPGLEVVLPIKRGRGRPRKDVQKAIAAANALVGLSNGTEADPWTRSKNHATRSR